MVHAIYRMIASAQESHCMYQQSASKHLGSEMRVSDSLRGIAGGPENKDYGILGYASARSVFPEIPTSCILEALKCALYRYLGLLKMARCSYRQLHYGCQTSKQRSTIKKQPFSTLCCSNGCISVRETRVARAGTLFICTVCGFSLRTTQGSRSNLSSSLWAWGRILRHSRVRFYQKN